MANNKPPDVPEPFREILEEERTGEKARRPFLKALSLWTMAVSEEPDVRDYPLEQIVTPESLDSWDLDEVSESVDDFGLYSKVDYLSPTWARVLMVRDVPEGKLTEDVEAPSPLAFYVKFVEELGDWRVHMLGRPDIPLEDLP
jgi:hypothetical protein